MSARILIAAACVVAIAGMAAAYAQPYPARPVRMIVPYAPGGGVDVMSRLIAPKLSERLGQQVVIDNRAGATGNIGAELAARSPADGYTLLMAGGSMAINVSLYPKLAYDVLKDFAPVTCVAESPNILLVHPSLPARSVAELIGLARSRPGQLNYASGGSGSTLHLTAELFKSMTGVNIVHVPYKGTAPAVIAVISGEAAIAMPPLAGMLSYVESGRLRALAVTSRTRMQTLPRLPTVAESGVPGFESGQWYGVLVPAATPEPVIAKLQGEINAVTRSAEIATLIVEQGSIPLAETPTQFGMRLRRDIAKWAKVIKSSGARVE